MADMEHDRIGKARATPERGFAITPYRSAPKKTRLVVGETEMQPELTILSAQNRNTADEPAT